jgi:tetratricopeptide (TPR) repeat protein
MAVTKEDLRERYEASGDERFFEQARPLYEQALQASPGDAGLLREYGYLLECHGRYAIRAAAGHYQRAIDADPRQEKAHYQLFTVLGALGDLDAVIPRYEQQAAGAPGDVTGYRLLAAACLRARDYGKAGEAIFAGLQLARDDPALTEFEGDLHAAEGRRDEALAAWRRAAALAPDDYGISMRFSSAFLLERLGRPADAAGEWRFIIGWMEDRGEAIHLDWPRRELARLEAQLAGG